MSKLLKEIPTYHYECGDNGCSFDDKKSDEDKENEEDDKSL